MFSTGLYPEQNHGIIKKVLSVFLIFIFSVSTVSAADFKPGVRIKKERWQEVKGVPTYKYYQRGKQIGAMDLMKELEKYRVSHKNAELAHEQHKEKFCWCPLMLLFPIGTLIVVLGPHQTLNSKFWKYLDLAVNDYNRYPRSPRIK